MQTVYNKRKSLHLCNWKMKKRVKPRKGRYNENKGITVIKARTQSKQVEIDAGVRRNRPPFM